MGQILKIINDWTSNRINDYCAQYVTSDVHARCTNKVNLFLRENQKDKTGALHFTPKMWQISWERQAGPQHHQNELMCGTVARAQSEKLESPVPAFKESSSGPFST